MTDIVVTQETLGVLVTPTTPLRVTSTSLSVMTRTYTAAAANFPNSPSSGQLYTITDGTGRNYRYQWNGTSWKAFDAPTASGSTQINFPSSPAVNATYDINGLRWKFDGKSWVSQGQTP